MAFLRKLRQTVGLRTFPQYDDLIEANNAMISACEHDCQNRSEVRARLAAFSDRQNPELVPILRELTENYRELQNQKRETIIAHSQVKREVDPVDKMNADISDDKKKEAQLKQAYEKADKVAEAATQRYEQDTQNKKKQTEMEAATQKKTAALAELAAFQEKFNEKEKEYKKKVFGALLGSLMTWARTRKGSVKSMVSIGEKMEELSEKIPFCYDEDVAAIRKSVEALRKEINQ